MKKIELVQIGQTSILEGFTPYAAGIYVKRVSISVAEQAASPITIIFSAVWDTDIGTDPITISGVSKEGLIFSEVGAVAELYLQAASWFFDFNNQLLYVTLFNYNNFSFSGGDRLSIGETIGFLSKAQLENINGVNYPLNTFLGSVFYEPRLNSESISIVNSINNQKTGIFVYRRLSLSIKNADGKYDSIRADITGNNIELLIANLSESPEEEIETGFPYKLAADPEDFRIVRKGIVEDVNYSDPSNPVITAIDPRANWTQKIATDLLTVAEFTGLPDKYVNKRKPFLIGPVDGAECIPLRADGAAASFDYLITDTQYGSIQSTSAVYFKGEISGTKEDRFLTGGEYSINLSTGIITVNNVNKGDVWIYGVFTTMTETVEIILFLLLTFDNFAFTSSNFNIDEVNAIKNLNYKTQVNITTKGIELRDVIEKLCADIQVDMFQQGDVLTMRQANVIAIAQEEIPNYQIEANPPPWNTDRANTIKTISVSYNKDYRTDLSDTYYDDSEQATAIENNRKAIDQSFDTNLTLEADVIEIFTAYYSRFVDVPRLIPLKRTIAFSSGVSDFITFPVIRVSIDGEKEIFPEGIYKIIEIDEKNDIVKAVFFRNVSEDIGPFTLSYDAISYDFLSGRG